MSIFTIIRSVSSASDELKSVKAQCDLCWAKLDITDHEKSCRCGRTFSYYAGNDDDPAPSCDVAEPPAPTATTRFNFDTGDVTTVRFCGFCGREFDEFNQCSVHNRTGVEWPNVVARNGVTSNG